MTGLQPLPVPPTAATAAAESLSYAQLDFRFRLSVDARGLGYLGPTIRGAFGHRFKASVCHVGHGQCGRCFLRDSCPFPLVFDGYVAGRDILRKYPAAPQPFVLDVASPGRWAGQPEEIRFGVRLFGPAAEHAAAVLEACRSFEESGLGPRRLTPRLEQVDCAVSGRVLWRAGDAMLTPPTRGTIAPFDGPRDGLLRLHFETPLAIRVGGKPCSMPSGLDLVLAGRRRHFLLETLYGSATIEPSREIRLEADAFRTVRNDLRRWSASRFSGRQRRSIDMQGMLGSLDIEGPWSDAGAWIGLAHLLHVGKQTAFGFGRLRWEQLT